MSELAHRDQAAASLEGFVPDRARAMAALGFDPRNPHTHAALLLANTYGLDPVLGHLKLIPGKGGMPPTIWITRDGYLFKAKQHPQWDGLDLIEEDDGGGPPDGTYFCRVVCKRKGQPDQEGRAWYRWRQAKANGGTYIDENADEMCLQRAERRALRRQFPLSIFELDVHVEDGEPVAAPASVVEIARKMSDPPVPVSPPAGGRGGSDPTSEQQTAVPDDTQHNGPQYSPEAGSVASGGHVRGARRPGSARSDPMSEGDTASSHPQQYPRAGQAAAPRGDGAPSDPTSEGEAHGGAESLRDSSLPPSDPTVPAGVQPNARAAGAPAGTPTSEGEGLRRAPTSPSDSTSPTSVRGKQSSGTSTSGAAAAADTAGGLPSAAPASMSAAGSSNAPARSGDGPAGSPAADQTSGEETADGASVSEGPQTPQLLAFSPDPKSPTRPVSRQPGRVGGNLQDPPIMRVPDDEEIRPVFYWCQRNNVDIRQAKVALRKQFKTDFGWLQDWRDLQELEGEQARNAIVALEAIYLDPGEGKP